MFCHHARNETLSTNQPPLVASPASTLPALAGRVDLIEPFHVMELVKRARELERQGRSIIHLSIGEPDFTAPPDVVAALQAAAEAGATGYTGALGLLELRQAIAEHYRTEFGLEVDPGRIVVTAGASAALLLACCALVNAGDRVLLGDPTYPCNRHFVSAFDGIAQGVPVDASTRFQLDAAAVEANWKDDVRGVLLASPANPTGTSVPFDELGRLIDVVRRRGGFSIVDEIYLGLHYDGRARSALEHGDDIVVLSSFSKFFCMTGWRLGWLVVPPQWVSAFEKLAQNLFICASTLSQRAALACFTPASMAEFHRRREQFRARRDYIVPALRELGLDVPVTPDGAFYVYIDCSRWSDDSERFAIELLEQAGVSLVPGMDFGSHAPKRYLRLSYATSLEQLHEAIERMRAWLATRTPLR
jgi:aspartate/methionine/tyrosine aminotransferase